MFVATVELKTMPNPHNDLDPAALARIHRIGGNALLTQMIDLFLEITPQRIEQACQAKERGDLKAVAESVHALRSSAGNIGASQLGDLAAKVEQLAGSGLEETNGTSCAARP